MVTEARKRRIPVVAIVGVIFVILGVLWATVIFPSFDKLPADYSRGYSFEGTFQVPDQQNPGQMISFPIQQEIQGDAVETIDGNAIRIHSVRTVKNAYTGDDISQIYGEDTVITVDRRTLEFVTNEDEQNRTGYWGPPRPLSDSTVFALWNPGAHRALDAKFVRSETFRDLNVLVFEINETDIPLGNQSGMDLYYTTTINLWIEPTSGTVVNQTSTTTTSMDMGGQKIPIQISEVHYAEESIVDLLETGKSAKTMLTWFQGVIPWLLIGIGAVMVVVDVAFLGRRKTSA